MVVLAVVAWRAAKLTAKFSREMTLICESACEPDFGQGPACVNKRAAGHIQAELPQILLRCDVKVAKEFALEGANGHMGQPRELLVGDRLMVMIAQVGEDGAEFVTGGDVALGKIEPPGDARGADDLAIGRPEGNFIGNIPRRQAVWMTNELDAVDDALSSEDELIIKAKLIGEEWRGEIVVGFADDVVEADGGCALAAGEIISDQEGAVHPAITTLAIFDPDL